MKLKVDKMTEINQREAMAFLSRYEETAVFLLGNFHEHGPSLGTRVNSGNFKILQSDGSVVGVFCLSRRGNLFVQSEVQEPAFDLILEHCKQEPMPLRGIIGDWNFAHIFWQYLLEKKIIRKEVYFSKEINYSLILDHRECYGDPKARLLEPSDYSSWIVLRKNYLKEQKLPYDISDEDMFAEYLNKSQRSMIWGLFVGSHLISIANLNAKTERLATVGGVYTMPAWRKQGFGKALMEQVIYDCNNKLSLHKLIISTGEQENKPAQKLYESLGCRKVGYMALLFGL
jgi:predicted GNAT family N-acyltransferase